MASNCIGIKKFAVSLECLYILNIDLKNLVFETFGGILKYYFLQFFNLIVYIIPATQPILYNTNLYQIS